MAFRVPVVSGRSPDPPSVKSRPVAGQKQGPAPPPATFQIITPCFAEGCHICSRDRGLSSFLHLVRIPLEAPQRPARRR